MTIGIDSNETVSKFNFRIYANRTGAIDYANFNGYTGEVKFDRFLDVAEFCETLKPERYGNTSRFDRRLYESIDPCTDVEQLKQLCCENCLRGESFKINVEAKIPMTLMKIEVLNPNDKLHVYNATTGRFEMVLNDMIWHAHAVNGVFHFGENNIEFKATSLKQFNIVIAYYSDNKYNLKYTLTTDLRDIKSRLLSHPFEHQDGVYRFPPDLQMDTVLILGIIPSEDFSIIDVIGGGVLKTTKLKIEWDEGNITGYELSENQRLVNSSSEENFV